MTGLNLLLGKAEVGTTSLSRVEKEGRVTGRPMVEVLLGSSGGGLSSSSLSTKTSSSFSFSVSEVDRSGLLAL